MGTTIIVLCQLKIYASYLIKTFPHEIRLVLLLNELWVVGPVSFSCVKILLNFRI